MLRVSKRIVAIVALVLAAIGSHPVAAADVDLQVIQQLEDAGSDLSKPHPIEFFLYFPSESTALRAARRIRAAGFTVQVQPGASGPRWLCLATREMVPDHAALARIRADFNRLAAEFGGEYDGWGTPVVR